MMDMKTKMSLFETNPHMALDVAVEIIGVRIARAMNAWSDAENTGNAEDAERRHDELLRLMKVRDDLYRGDEETLRMVLEKAVADREWEQSPEGE